MTQNQKKLLKILNEIFQLDQSDLDFGIYRIMNTKSKEINEFLDNDLLSSVASAFSSNDNNSTQKELDEALQQAQSLGADPETLPKVIALREQLSLTTTSSNLENEVFSHLANFFRRYYKDGDFVSLRRYKKDTYAIPYEGEEVKLHWANSDQYYIKSGEYFRDYSFTVNGKTIHFKLSDAETESNNNKATSDKERRFIYIGSEVLTSPKELNINFEYKAVGKGFKQDKLNEEAISKVLEDLTDEEFTTALNTLVPTEKNKKRTIFEKHLKSYTSRNSFDYFIHKDLGGFLSRELDFYIKNEMLFLDDIMDSPIKYEEVMGKVKIFKSVSQKIINFLTQLEELQKKLWEKKKFVIETNYCITLDKIDEDYYEEIFENKEQIEEWRELFGDEALASFDGTKVPAPEEIKYLVLDTKFFDMKFKYMLLSEFDNLDEQIDGVLINSENFGALNLLQDRYKEQVKTVYIDPPYNTGSDGFSYNDGYAHSSWMSFMYDRLALGRELMSDDGVIFSSIDDNEQINFRNLKNIIFKENNFVANIAHKARASVSNDKIISSNHNHILYYAKNYETVFKNRKHFGLKPILDGFKKDDNDGKGKYKYSPVDGPGGVAKGNPYYTFEGVTGFFRYSKEEMQKKYDRGEVVKVGNGLQKKFYLDYAKTTKKTDTTWWDDKLYTSSATTQLKNLMNGNYFTNPKHIDLVKRILEQSTLETSYILDYFAGSGTTGHSVINLNREDNGKRKYILVEMGEYFNTVTKPRIQKVIYSDSWKDGKPTTKNGVSQIFKYFKLESYEDTLNNLEFTKTKEQQKAFEYYPEAKEDYILNYSLDVESQDSLLNIDSFKSPFNYKLKIATSGVGETQDTNIDLVETFNYLLGLVVEKVDFRDGFLTIIGQNLKDTKILIIWRDNKTNDELDEFVKGMELEEFDEVYVNGDNNLEKVILIEQEFKRLMFGE